MVSKTIKALFPYFVFRNTCHADCNGDIFCMCGVLYLLWFCLADKTMQGCLGRTKSQTFLQSHSSVTMADVTMLKHLWMDMGSVTHHGHHPTTAQPWWHGALQGGDEWGNLCNCILTEANLTFLALPMLTGFCVTNRNGKPYSMLLLFHYHLH